MSHNGSYERKQKESKLLKRWLHSKIPEKQHLDQNFSQLNCQAFHLVQEHYQWSYAAPNDLKIKQQQTKHQNDQEKIFKTYKFEAVT